MIAEATGLTVSVVQARCYVNVRRIEWRYLDDEAKA